MPYKAYFERFSNIACEFGECADFLCIYIEEAHAADVHKTRVSHQINQHKTIEDRIEAARTIVKLKPSVVPIVVDKMEGDANKTYGGLFERLHVVLDGKMFFIGGLGPVYYSVDKVHEWLIEHKRKNC